MASGVHRATVTMTGTGDADLLIGQKGQYPKVYGDNLCESETKGTSNETCSFAVSEGTYYVRARNRLEGSVVTIKATLE